MIIITKRQLLSKCYILKYEGVEKTIKPGRYLEIDLDNNELSIKIGFEDYLLRFDSSSEGIILVQVGLFTGKLKFREIKCAIVSKHQNNKFFSKIRYNILSISWILVLLSMLILPIFTILLMGI